MKKTAFLMLCLAMSFVSLAQSSSLPRTDYLLRKSKKQKTAAFVLLGGGAGLAIVGTVIGANRLDDEIGRVISEGEDDEAFAAGGVMMVTGVAAMLGSVPLFIASSKNKRKAYAASTYIKMQTIPVVYQRGIGKIPYPAACIQITL